MIIPTEANSYSQEGFQRPLLRVVGKSGAARINLEMSVPGNADGEPPTADVDRALFHQPISNGNESLLKANSKNASGGRGLA